MSIAGMPGLNLSPISIMGPSTHRAIELSGAANQAVRDANEIGLTVEQARKIAEERDAGNPVQNATRLVEDQNSGLDPTTQALLSVFDRIPRGMKISDVFQSVGALVDAAGLTSDNQSATQIGRGVGSLANGNLSGARDIANGAGLNLPFNLPFNPPFMNTLG